MASESNRIEITGGTFTGSAVGNRDVRVTHVHGAREVAIGDLRATLAAERAGIVGLGADQEQRSRLSSGVEQVEDELRTEQPDGDVVRGGWKRVLRVLDGAAAASGSVGRISQAIAALFPA